MKTSTVLIPVNSTLLVAKTSKQLDHPRMGVLAKLQLQYRRELRRKNLARLLDDYGQTSVHKATGISEAYLWQMAKGEGKQARGVSDANARKIELGLNLKEGWLDLDPDAHPGLSDWEGAPLSDQDTLGNGIAEPVSQYGETLSQTVLRQIPVRGTASMGMDGFWADLEYPVGHGDGYFEHPTCDRDAYVLRVKGDSMHPAIRSGWFVLVEPNGEPQQGEYVLVKLIDGRSTVKELLWHRNGEYVLLAIANGARHSIPESQVEGIYPIAAVLPPSKRRL